MNRDEVLEEVEGFLDEAEENGTEDFRIDDNYDIITIISLMD
jgi:hypothetical protein